MKRNGLLAAPWADGLPNAQYVDVAGKPTVRVDFTVPTDGQIALGHGAARLLPRHGELAQAAGLARGTWGLGQSQSGPVHYPQPPDFVGTTFLKQALATFSADPSVLAKPVEAANFGVTAPLWAWLEDVHPHLWRQGRAFPANYPAMRQPEIWRSTSPSRSTPPASSAIKNGELPDTVRSFVLRGDDREHPFVAIPFNASAGAGPKSSPIS